MRAFAKHGWRVRAAVRRPDLAGHLQPMGAVGQIHAVQANVRHQQSIEAAVFGADLVINFVGILAASGRQTYDSVHVKGARAVAKAAKQAGATQFVHISALGADHKSPSEYGRTRALGEQAVLEEFPEAVILRPSIVFGPEDEFYNRFAVLAKNAPFMPLIAGAIKFQPVYVGDLADAIFAASEGKARSGTVYEIGGPEILTFRQILDSVRRWTDRQRPYLPLPLWLMELQTILTSPLPNSLRPITLDQVRMLKVDNVVSDAAKADGRTLYELGITNPQAAGAIVPTYLERYKPRGQFSHYRG